MNTVFLHFLSTTEKKSFQLMVFQVSSSFALILPDNLYNGGFKEKLEETGASQLVGRSIAHQKFCEDKSVHFVNLKMGKITGASFLQYWHDRHDRISD